MIQQLCFYVFTQRKQRLWDAEAPLRKTGGSEEAQRWRNFFKLRVKLDSVGRYRDQARGPSVQFEKIYELQGSG